MARQDPFYKGQFFGLPTKSKNVPFGNDSAFKDAFGITETQTKVLVALIAAEAAGMLGATASQVDELVGNSAPTNMPYLERNGWAVAFARTETREKVWKATARAKRELGLTNWSVAA